MKFEAAASLDGTVRAGSQVLAIFEKPLNTKILRAHADGPLRLTELQDRLGWSAQTTVRAAVSSLCTFGSLVKEPVGTAPYAVVTSLTPAGEEMLFVADEIEAWLARAPGGPIEPEGQGARVAVKALAGAWGSSLMRVLASGPFTLTELAGLIPAVSYPALERRITWMRATGQIEPVEQQGRGTPYVVTDWLRYAIAPLCVAGRCERRHLTDKAGPITEVEVEAAFLLALPLIRPPEGLTSTCALVVRTDPTEHDSREPGLAGVTVKLRRGEISSCEAEVAAEPATWVVGTPEAWLDLVIDGRIDDLRVGGARPQLALDLVAGLHQSFFGSQ